MNKEEEFVDFDSMAKTYDESRGASIEILTIIKETFFFCIKGSQFNNHLSQSEKTTSFQDNGF